MDYRINGAGSYGNPFLQAFQRQQQNPFQLPRIGESTESSPEGDIYNLPGRGGFYQPFLGRIGVDKTLQDRRNKQAQERPAELQQMMDLIRQRSAEVSRLMQQVASAQNPEIKKMLQAMLFSQTAGFSSLQGQFNQQFNAISSGFVGSENKIDHIGSFVTLV